MATRLEDVALAVQVADCLPILMVDPLTKVIAAVHSGWRGMLAHVLPKTVQEIQRNFGVDPARLIAAVGPGIGSCCFEVSLEVAELFHKEFPATCSSRPSESGPGKCHLDLWQALSRDFDQAGIKPENRYDLGLCTCCHTHEFFSNRAEGKRAGRMMAVIGRISPAN